MEFSFRPRNDSGRPQLSALLSARGAEVFALKEACVLILGNVSATPSSRVETLPACSREARLCSAKGESGFGKIVPTRNPNVVTFREPHPGQNVRQTML